MTGGALILIVLHASLQSTLYVKVKLYYLFLYRWETYVSHYRVCNKFKVEYFLALYIFTRAFIITTDNKCEKKKKHLTNYKWTPADKHNNSKF